MDESIVSIRVDVLVGNPPPAMTPAPINLPPGPPIAVLESWGRPPPIDSEASGTGHEGEIEEEARVSDRRGPTAEATADALLEARGS